MALTLAFPSRSTMRNAVPRFSTCDHIAPGWTISSHRTEEPLINTAPFQNFEIIGETRDSAGGRAAADVHASQPEKNIQRNMCPDVQPRFCSGHDASMAEKSWGSERIISIARINDIKRYHFNAASSYLFASFRARVLLWAYALFRSCAALVPIMFGRIVMAVCK